MSFSATSSRFCQAHGLWGRAIQNGSSNSMISDRRWSVASVAMIAASFPPVEQLPFESFRGVLRQAEVDLRQSHASGTAAGSV